MLTSESLAKYINGLIGAGGDLAAFGPELVLCATVVVMLLAPLVIAGLATRLGLSSKPHMCYVALAGTLIAFWLTGEQWIEHVGPAGSRSREIFGGMLVYDSFTVYMRIFLLAFTVLVILLTMLTGIPDAEDSADFYTLLLGSVVGMSMMASANHLLMVFLAVEMASVPSYAMAGFLKGRRQSSEAALKYVVYGGAAAGVMLYGISLLAGMYSTGHLPTLAHAMLMRFSEADATAFEPTLLLALTLVLVGLAFKLSAFPFHFWCPDVFEGAAAEVAAFLSVASKGAAIALTARLVMALTGNFAGADQLAADWTPSLAAMKIYLGASLAVLGAVTATFGNLAAYGQTNLKRMLAYSTIAHAGYMIMSLAMLSPEGVQAAIFYLFVYLFMNLGAFAVVAFLRNRTGSEDLGAYAGLIHRAPWLTVAMCVFMLGLAGIPPLAGFVGKFQIFFVLYQAGAYALLVIAAVNSVVSLFYYVNVMRVMVNGEASLGPSLEYDLQKSYAAVLAVAVLILGIFWSLPDAIARQGVSAFDSGRQPAAVAETHSAQAIAIVANRTDHARESEGND